MGGFMLLATIKIGFPVLRLESLVRHATPRLPTVFERALLRLYERFTADGEFGRWDLASLFHRVLGVPETEALVRPALEELITLGVFTCSQSDRSRLDRIALAHLTMT